MVWYIGVKKGVTTGRTSNTEVFKCCHSPSRFTHGAKYHEVRGPFETYRDALEESHKFHVGSDVVIQGHHKTEGR
jgi:hypothetical protein